MLPELVSLDLVRNLPRMDAPVVIVQGRHDQVAPPVAAARFVTTLTAPTKRLAWFDHSAHMPHYEEPGPFRDLPWPMSAMQLSSLPRVEDRSGAFAAVRLRQIC
jgi:hypothetical protein